MDSEQPAHLIRFQIGPVQDFIAQARSTRDLWSGSYLLSWLASVGINHLLKQTDSSLIFPASGGQPLLDAGAQLGTKERLTPNLPNIFVARVNGDATATAKGVASAIRDEWDRIADSVWKERDRYNLNPGTQGRFEAQVLRHLSISWISTTVSEEDEAAYARDYRLNSWQLDAVRQTRDFAAWRAGGWETTGCEKDSLNGREEAVVGGKEWQKSLTGEYAHLFKHDDHLGAVSLIKRVWHLTYLRHQPGFKTAVQDFKIRSTRAIAARDATEDDQENVEIAQGERYLAAIVFDGDSIGAWVNGDDLPPGSDLHDHHQKFSACLSEFALKLVRPIVEDKSGGFLIYAGGDDVVALVPAEAALKCAEELHTAFRSATQDIKDRDGKTPDASAGIAIAHFKSPLQDLIRAAHEAEKHAKNTIGRPAFSVTIMKRSGETEVWGSKWTSGGLALHQGIAKAMTEGRLSGKFPYRVCALLSPYLTTRTGISRQQDATDFQAHAVIRHEFAHAIDRQSQGAGAAELLPLLDTYLCHLGTAPQLCIESIISLCKSVAFAQRNRPEPS